MTDAITLGSPAVNLTVIKQHTSVVVEPTSQMGGTYDTAEITTVLVVNNPSPQAQQIEFVVPYETDSFSASVAVISAGPEEFHNRRKSISTIKGDLERIKPYLAKLLLPADQYDTAKELRAIAGQFRAGSINVPAGQVTIKIQLSAIVEPSDMSGVKTFGFRAYSPLPAFGMAGGRTPLTLSVQFKGDESIRPKVTKHVETNPFGDGATNKVTEILGQILGEDILYYWKWQSDPVIDFEYHY